MTVEIPEPIRRAMEAQAKRTGRIDVSKVEETIAAGDPIPSDEEEALVHGWKAPEPTEDELADLRPQDEQTALWGDGPVPISYETLLPPHDVAAYKRVKAWTMEIADVARERAAALVSGTIGDGGRSGKQFIQTPQGKFRLATSGRSDNSTEIAAHERMGVETIHLSEPTEMIDWFARHGIHGRLAYDQLVRDLRARFRT